MAEDGMEHQTNGAKFVTAVLMTRRIVGTKVNRNATIARDSGTFKRIVVLQINNMLRTQKENLMKEIYFFSCQKALHEEGKNVWYLDSGCSNHMTGQKEAFINIGSSFGSKVKLGNGEHVEVK